MPQTPIINQAPSHKRHLGVNMESENFQRYVNRRRSDERSVKATKPESKSQFRGRSTDELRWTNLFKRNRLQLFSFNSIPVELFRSIRRLVPWLAGNKEHKHEFAVCMVILSACTTSPFLSMLPTCLGCLTHVQPDHMSWHKICPEN